MKNAPFTRIGLAVASVATAAGCGGGGAAASEAETVQTAPAVEPNQNEVALESLRREPEYGLGQSCQEVGFARVPASPTAAARRLNREALVAHQRGEFTTSAAGFRSALEAAPDYDAARFNLACALARLEQKEAALAELRQLLCTDLPSWRRRALDDSDLASIRFELEEDLMVLEPAFRLARDHGTMMVAYGNEETQNRNWTQAVAYMPVGARIVPIGPRVHHRGRDIPMTASFVEPSVGRGVNIVYGGNDAEDPHLNGIRISVFASPTGEPWATSPGPNPEEAPFLDVGLVQDAALVRGENANLEPLVWRLSEAGSTRTRVAFPSRFLHAEQSSWSVRQLENDLRIEQGALAGQGEPIALGRGHRAYDQHTVVVHPQRSLALAISAAASDCDTDDRFAMDLVDLTTRQVVWHRADVGQVLATFGPDGSLYLQLRSGTVRLPQPMLEAQEQLPDGLGLTSRFWKANPYC